MADQEQGPSFDEQLAELQRLVSGRGGIGSDARMPVRSAPQDGGDMSSFAARRLLGERAAIPAANVLMGPGELEDPEAAAFRSRTGYEHIPFANAAIGLAALVPAPFKAARDWVTGASADVNGLMREGYQPGADDGSREEQIKRSFNAAGLAGTGGFAASRSVGDAGSLGVFISRNGAKNMADSGRPTAIKAIDMAERMEARGVPEKSIREATNALIEAEDAKLGGVHKGEDGKWRVELDDSQARFRQAGPQSSRLARELDYPDLYLAHPDLMPRRIDRQPGRDSYYFPDEDSFLIGQGSASRKAAMLHEVEHATAKRNDLAPGASPADFEDGARGANLRRPGETPTQAYNRVLGEQYAGAVEQRMTYDAAKRRRIPPQASIEQRRKALGLEDRTIFVDEHGRAKSIGRERNPDELPAFDQAQEKTWEELAQIGTAHELPAWTTREGGNSQRGGGPGRAPSDLWSREANLGLAQMYKRGEQPADIAAKLGNRYTEDQVVSQLEALGLVGSNRKLPSSAVGEWQPDAVKILQSDRINGMSAADVAKLIEEETGQVTTKNAVIGKLDRLRKSRARDELAEDLAKTKNVKAAGLPLSSDDEPSHHSALQPRNDIGQFDGPPKKVQPSSVVPVARKSWFNALGGN